uniref:79 kDa salivary apyrase n=1 Tax=Triatoma infestans TaxID=30076 RepID=Q70GK8_TRIIF|nr:79 kDa salivary apyrase precursor [Triatoma infestans]
MYVKIQIFLWFYAISTTIATLEAQFKLTLLHTNDMHSRIEETNNKTRTCTSDGPCYGGFARLAHKVKQIKKKTPNTLFLNAGDTYQGTPMYTLFKWHPFPKLMDMLGIDAMSLGNHEFDDGVAGLVPYLQAINITVVTCNLNASAEPKLKDLIKPWKMFTIKGVNIAVIGYMTPDTKFLSSTGEVTFSNEVEMIKHYASEAKEKGANLIFAVGHSGINIDKEIAAKVPDIDVVVGGHTDTFLYTGSQPDIEKPAAVYPLMIKQESGKQVPVVQAFGYTKYLGKLDLVWHPNFTLASATGNPILLNSSVCKDPEVEKETLQWIEKLKGILEQRKGTTRVVLNGSCRYNECNFGNFLADAVTYYVANQTKDTKKWTDVPITLINGGSIRKSIETRGNITWGDLLVALPFNKQIVSLRMKGSTLLKALHRSVERYDITRKSFGFGEFLQVSGMRVYYKQNETGHLVLKRALTRCAKCLVPKYSDVKENKYYLVLTTIFVANGGDGFDMFKAEAKTERVYEEDDLNIMAQYLEKTSPVYPGEEGRVFIPNVLKQVTKKLES